MTQVVRAKECKLIPNYIAFTNIYNDTGPGIPGTSLKTPG